MITDDRVMAILERANPVPPGELVDVPVGATRYLETALEQRSEPMTIVDPTPTRTADPERPPQRRWPLVAVAASVVAIVVASIALIVATQDDATVVDQPDPTVPPTLPATAPDAPAAQTVVDGFVEAFNSGDTDAIAATIADDAVIPTDDDDLYDQAVHHQGTGTIWRDAMCTLAADQQPDSTTLNCRWEVWDHLVQAVDGEPWEMIATVVVADREIAELRMDWGIPNWEALGRPWVRWMDAYHPGVRRGLEFPDTADEIPKLSEEEARWAQAWAAWLESYGCEPTSPCTIALDRWVAEYDAQCRRLEPQTLPDESLVDHIRLLPISSDLQVAQFRLTLADAELVEPGLTAERIAQLQQQRLEAMVELGVDPACHPTIG